MIDMAAMAAGMRVNARFVSPGSTRAARPTPTRITPTTFATLVSRKKATVRRAISVAGIPPRFSAQAPSARPPAPPVGKSAFAPSSDIPI